MLNDFSGADKVYIACGYTDLRKGIDGLARMVQQQFELDPFTNTLFLFCGRRRDRIKGLYWEKDGFILLYKRLEQGAYQWPRSESKVQPRKWWSTVFAKKSAPVISAVELWRRLAKKSAAACKWNRLGSGFGKMSTIPTPAKTANRRAARLIF